MIGTEVALFQRVPFAFQINGIYPCYENILPYYIIRVMNKDTNVYVSTQLCLII